MRQDSRCGIDALPQRDTARADDLRRPGQPSDAGSDPVRRDNTNRGCVGQGHGQVLEGGRTQGLLTPR
jgi:hypothetical protein